MPLAPALLAPLLAHEPTVLFHAIADVRARAEVYRRWQESLSITYPMALALLQEDIRTRGLALDATELMALARRPGVYR